MPDELELSLGEIDLRVGPELLTESWRPGDLGHTGVKSKSMPLKPLMAEQPALVVLGDPGAGKSTLLKHHALGLANDRLGHLPILVPLDQYAQALAKEPLPLRSFLPRHFATRRQNLAGLEPLFEQALEHGRAVVLLDGVDEVQEARGALVRRLADFVREVVPAPDADPLSSPVPPGNRVVVTSRFVGCAEPPLTEPRWRLFAVEDWDLDGIGRFLERWTYAVELAMAGGKRTPEVKHRADEERRSILAAAQANGHIARLAGNPLLLTILALIKRQGVSLPHRRVGLYELYLKTLLYSWRKTRALDDTPIGPEIDYHAAWYVLAALGLWLRETSPQYGLGEERQMRDFLVRYFRDQEGYAPREAREEAAALGRRTWIGFKRFLPVAFFSETTRRRRTFATATGSAATQSPTSRLGARKCCERGFSENKDNSSLYLSWRSESGRGLGHGRQCLGMDALVLVVRSSEPSRARRFLV